MRYIARPIAAAVADPHFALAIARKKKNNLNVTESQAKYNKDGAGERVFAMEAFIDFFAPHELNSLSSITSTNSEKLLVSSSLSSSSS